MAHKSKQKPGRGRKKDKYLPVQPDMMPGLPYGADPWIEAQPVELPDLPAGHIHTVFPVGLIMPSGILDAKEIARDETAAAFLDAEAEDTIWENACEEVEFQLQTVMDRSARYHETNVFLEKLLSTNEKDTAMLHKYLSDSSRKLQKQVTGMEEELKKAQLAADHQLQLREDKHKVISADLEKKLADQEKRLYDLALEHADLRKFEEARDAMQLAVDELRNNVYANEKQHRRAVMQADENRRKSQRKAKEDSQAALEELAKQGCVAANENIARQTKKLSTETGRLTDVLRYVCKSVRKNREDVKQLRQLLEDCVLDHDSIVSACEAKLREYGRSERKLETLMVLTNCVEREQKVALDLLENDSRKVFNSIEHSFYDRDKEILLLENTNQAIANELCKLKSEVLETTSSHDLVERFVMSTLHVIKARRSRQLQREEKRATEFMQNN